MPAPALNLPVWQSRPPSGSGFLRVFLQGVHLRRPDADAFHRHSGGQLCVVRRGAGTAVIANASGRAVVASFTLAPGDAIFFPARQPHAWDQISPAGLDILAFDLDPRRSPVSAALLGPLPARVNLPGFAHDARVATLLEDVETEGRATALGRDEALAALARRVLIEAARLAHTAPAPASSRPRAPSTALARACAYMSANLANPIGLDDVARAADLGVSQLGRIFSASLGETPAAALRRLRVDHARHLLLSTNEPLERIARACGLNCAQHLCRVFRTVAGTTPQSYRRSTRTRHFG